MHDLLGKIPESIVVRENYRGAFAYGVDYLTGLYWENGFDRKKVIDTIDSTSDMTIVVEADYKENPLKLPVDLRAKIDGLFRGSSHFVPFSLSYKPFGIGIMLQPDHRPLSMRPDPNGFIVLAPGSDDTPAVLVKNNLFVSAHNGDIEAIFEGKSAATVVDQIKPAAIDALALALRIDYLQRGNTRFVIGPRHKYAPPLARFIQ